MGQILRTPFKIVAHLLIILGLALLLAATSGCMVREAVDAVKIVGKSTKRQVTAKLDPLLTGIEVAKLGKRVANKVKKVMP